MELYELNKYRDEKDHQMSKGHLTAHDREKTAYHRYGFLNTEDKMYHSPERPETMEGEY